MAATALAENVVSNNACGAGAGVEGCLLLSIGKGVVFSLNGSALVVWSALERSTGGLGVEQMVQLLARTYAESGTSIDVFREDVSRLMGELTRKGFVSFRKVGEDGGTYAVEEDVFRASDGDSVKDALESGFAPGLIYKPMDKLARGLLRSISDAVSGWLAILSYDLVLKVSGFGKVCRLVEQRSISRRKEWSFDRVREICAGVDRARLWYPKNVVCLQHSAVVTWLLRGAGVPARMVFAGRRVPFYAHAWCEVEGTVVNDEQSVRNRYSLFRRCREAS